jgi:NitT/TauT family transport system substrate-binding protein
MTRKWVFHLAGCTIAMLVMLSSGHAQENFNVRFSWKLKGEYAPFYLAQQMGFFAKQGLKVRLGEGAGSEAALGSLIQGQEDVVIIPGIYALSAVSKGMPIKIIALYQPKAPTGILSHLDKPITTPKDLEGKTLAATVGDTTMDYLKVFCSENHVDCDKIKIVMMNVQARLPQFMNRQVDGMSTYWNIDLPQLEYSTHQKFALLDMVKYGQVVPGLSAVTSDADIAREPDKLKRFLLALNQGFDATKDGIKPAAEALRAAWQGAPPEELVETQVRLSNQTFPVLGGKIRGSVDEKVLTEALQLLLKSGQISEAKPISAYYSNQLLPNH